MSEDGRSESGFKVSDRRKFSLDGEPIDSAETKPSSEAGSDSAQAGVGEDPLHSTGVAEDEPEEETVDFSGFLLSLATSAMAYMGEVPDPTTGQRMENLEGAKQMIEIISMLQVKTEGNLEPEEARLIDGLLYELRMKYLSRRKVITL